MVTKNKTSWGNGAPRRLLTERDLKSLRVFCAAAQASGITAATSQLHLSKASVSRHILEIEERLGVKLCERGPGGFRLTNAGTVALEVTSRALRALDRIQPDIDAATGVLTGPLTIGLVEHILTDPACTLPTALNELRHRAPDVYPEIVVLTHTQLNRALRERRVQIAIRGQYQRDRTFNYLPLFEELHRLYVARDVNEQAASRLQLVYRHHPFVDKIMATGRFQRGPDAGGLEAIATFIATGNFIGMLPAHYAELINVRYPIRRVDESIEFHNQICAITEASRPLPASAELFLDILQSQQPSK
ncbi:LysR family transcriptional regulator [Castellaniella caeni]|uniref:LysR family transcriptional regulator n=1 Tax=Castellaniella caeni TaxID=266123 RepID=UPI000C9ECFD7|nr:LysR family transcriptional regulator [Castellaniella caeni]